MTHSVSARFVIFMLKALLEGHPEPSGPWVLGLWGLRLEIQHCDLELWGLSLRAYNPGGFRKLRTSFGRNDTKAWDLVLTAWDYEDMCLGFGD